MKFSSRLSLGLAPLALAGLLTGACQSGTNVSPPGDRTTAAPRTAGPRTARTEPVAAQVAADRTAEEDPVVPAASPELAPTLDGTQAAPRAALAPAEQAAAVHIGPPETFHNGRARRVA